MCPWTLTFSESVFLVVGLLQERKVYASASRQEWDETGEEKESKKRPVSFPVDCQGDDVPRLPITWM
jgi:hypothetical protein